MTMTFEVNELSCRLNDVPTLSCFICGKLITGTSLNILDTETQSFGTPLADKLGKIIGHKYLVVISEKDKACCVCVKLVNHLEELEQELWITKQKILTLLECTYNIHLEDVLPKPYGSETIHDGKEEKKYNAAFKTKTPLNCKVEDVGSTNVSFEKVDSQEDFNGDEPAVKVDLIPKPPVNSNLLSKLPLQYHLFSDIHLDVLKEEIVQEASEDDCGILYSTEYVTRSNSFEKPLNDDSSELIIESIADELPEEKATEEERIIGEEKKEILTSNVKEFLCEICDVPFPKPYLLMRHKRVHEKSNERVTCPLCHLECHDRLHYSYHRKNKHDLLNRLSCTVCDKNFLSNKDLKNHLLSAHDGDDFQCSLCGEQFKRHSQLTNHKLYAHGKRNCRICGKHIFDDIKLRQHENRHAWIESKNLTCDVCGRSFKTPGGLRVHKVSHTGKYKFFCEFCGRGFMSLVILEEHKGVHTREERYVCDICGRKFVLYSTFHLHKQWHKDPFPFPCKFCKKKFKYRSVRSVHMRRDHTGLSPYKCHYCNAEFQKAISLKKHITTHTKEFPYNCNVCFKGFIQRRNLARHMTRIHNDSSLNLEPKFCEYKVVLRPDEFPTTIVEAE